MLIQSVIARLFQSKQSQTTIDVRLSVCNFTKIFTLYLYKGVIQLYKGAMQVYKGAM
jgi:hypothetical protein